MKIAAAAAALFLFFMPMEALADCTAGESQVCNNTNGCSGGTQTCKLNTKTFETYWTACSGSGSAACTVCGRSGTATCTNGVPNQSTCTAVASEICNNCDDNLDTYVDNKAYTTANNTLDTCPRLFEATLAGDDVQEFGLIHCGGNAPSGGSNVCPCVAGWQSSTSDTGKKCTANTTYSRDNLSSDALACANGADCRFRIVSGTELPAGGPASKAIRFIIKDGDVLTSTGLDERNEVVYLDEGGGKQYAEEGDDRYYAWSTRFDNFEANTSSNDFRTFAQFHEVGECGNGLGGPGLQLAVYNYGNGPELRLTKRDDYTTSTNTVLWPPAGETFSIAEDQWYDFVLHVKWSQTKCTPDDPANLKGWVCNFPEPNGGLVELWIDGTRKISVPTETLLVWPSPVSGCTESYQGTTTAGSSMPVYLKTGIYRNNAIADTETVYQAGWRSGETCSCLDAGGCVRF